MATTVRGKARGGKRTRRARTPAARPWRSGVSSPYYEVALRAAREALNERLVHDFWEYFKEIREERPEIQEAEAVIGRAITEYFSPEAVRARLARKRKRRARKRTGGHRTSRSSSAVQ
jgi:hypothetical protein